MPDPIAISEAQCNYSKYILLLLITGGGHFRITMTVDQNMEFEKKGLGNSEKVMDFFALGGVQTLYVQNCINADAINPLDPKVLACISLEDFCICPTLTE
jgi:hypothetical protein